MKTPFSRAIRLLIAALIGSVLGAAVAAVSPGSFFPAWLGAAVLLIPAVYLLLSAWQWAGGGRLLAWLVALAFLLRLVTGIGLSLALPAWGYAEPEQQAGYVFKDAFARDTQAWELSRSGAPLWSSFRNEFTSDQYGGLLALSALVYRYLSPDAHRPFLIIILGAFVAALGVPFLDKAIRLRWPARVAVLAGWIYTCYPDALFFAGSQMREPFLVGLSAVAFWAVLAWDWRARAPWLALAGSLAGMAVISSRVSVALAGFLALLFLLEYVAGRSEKRWQVLGWIGLGLGFLLVMVFTWGWFRSSAAWDLLVTTRNSGWVTRIISQAGEQFRVPIIVGYGLAQPVLPAAVAEPADSALWKAVIILRSLGWYALAPLLVYGVFTSWKEPDRSKRLRVLWLALAVVLWLLIASARGGGDMTDNPRYRSLFIPWMALLAAWAVDWALSHRDAWLWRWMAVEVIFLGFFTNWYFSRYFRVWARLPFWHMVFWIVGLSALVLVGGWLWDRYHHPSRPAVTPDSPVK